MKLKLSTNTTGYCFRKQAVLFVQKRKHTAEQACKAMYLLFMIANNLDLPLDLPLDLQMKLFDNTLLPILTNGSEIYGYGNLEIMERIHTEFLRKITKLRKSTPRYMLYAELGRHPIEVNIKTRTINYWSLIFNGKISKISHQIYLYRFNARHNFKWLDYVQSIFNECGLN